MSILYHLLCTKTNVDYFSEIVKHSLKYFCLASVDLRTEKMTVFILSCTFRLFQLVFISEYCTARLYRISVYDGKEQLKSVIFS